MLKRSNPLTTVASEVRLLYSVDEAAALMGIGHSLLWDLVMRREIASIKVGRSRRIPLSALHDYVARKLLEQDGGRGVRDGQARQQ